MKREAATSLGIALLHVAACALVAVGPAAGPIRLVAGAMALLVLPSGALYVVVVARGSDRVTAVPVSIVGALAWVALCDVGLYALGASTTSPVMLVPALAVSIGSAVVISTRPSRIPRAGPGAAAPSILAVAAVAVGIGVGAYLASQASPFGPTEPFTIFATDPTSLAKPTTRGADVSSTGDVRVYVQSGELASRIYAICLVDGSDRRDLVPPFAIAPGQTLTFDVSVAGVHSPK